MKEYFLNRGKENSFAGKYYCYNLVYFEEHFKPMDAIDREKEIKKFTRKQKEELINSKNPEWNFIRF